MSEQIHRRAGLAAVLVAGGFLLGIGAQGVAAVDERLEAATGTPAAAERAGYDRPSLWSVATERSDCPLEHNRS